ncbi:prolipoprotein diacylglyceryl transferase family protein [Roseibacillus ishigakijimensis]|uniref:Prolipoprotein diacylglyceryl transferase n=1 Tax=Roseibacillus ishigakijimensis TaxID=454146 RepID=A0A934RP13_9BACT|nr:prolipoprotein diacylglyceryl transferase family protein [Roseibacillus ishigakijimensis]MBK1833187.1 prolipoprotein diacylglyceryl transferase [Roseibacillus ishigakijimensis]
MSTLFPSAPNAGFPYYPLTLLLGIILSAVYWIRRSKNDPLIPLIYGAALACAFLGAKLAYLLSEGWLVSASDQRLLHWLTGKSVTGALLGGFLGVEGAKKLLGYRKATGDGFAAVVPLALIVGRLGCLSHGCCRGIACSLGPLTHWPAVQVEIAFNGLAFLLFFNFRRFGLLRGQHFHLYLIAYGLFRFGHEFLRATPKPFLGLSGYQLFALALTFIGLLAFRRRQLHPPIAFA